MENNLTYKNVYQKFKLEFSEDIDFFIQKENEFKVDSTDGAHLQFSIIVVPYLYHLVDIQNEIKIKKCFNFIDKMSKSGDKELIAIVQFSILEDIVSNKDYYNKLKDYFTDEIKSFLPYLHSYIDF